MRRNRIFNLVLVALLGLFILCSCGNDSDGATDGDTTDGDVNDGDIDYVNCLEAGGLCGDADGNCPDGYEPDDKEWDCSPAPCCFPIDTSDGDTTPPFDYCDGENPPDAECWKEKRDPSSEYIALATRIADWQIEKHDPAEMRWEWTHTVNLIGIAQLARVSGKTEYFDFIASWLDHNIEEGYEIGSSDSCAPAALALELLKVTGDEKYQAVLNDALSYIYDPEIRTEYGGIKHWGKETWMGTALWIDSLFMFGNVLTGVGEYLNDDDALTEYLTQFNIFTAQLQSDSGFYKHATDEVIFDQEPDVYWGRGNGWILAAGADHMRVRINNGDRETVAAIEQALLSLAAAFIDSQDSDSGIWWTVLNRPGAVEGESANYLETSVAALVAYGLSRGWRYGIFDDSVLPVIKRALDGIITNIGEDDDGHPVVLGISGPTNPGTARAYYDIPIREDISYGVGAVLLALVEASGLPLPE